MNKIVLILLPYASGTSFSYSTWKKYFENDIELYALDLPGRGNKNHEKYEVDINIVIESLTNEVLSIANSQKYAIFGHSMGTLLAYEIYGRIKRLSANKPEYLFFSGSELPCEYLENTIINSDTDLYQYLENAVNIPQLELAKNELFMSIVEDVKKDYVLFSKYRYSNISIESKGVIFYGTNDQLVTENRIGWNQIFKNKPSYYVFPGSHMFIRECTEEVCHVIKTTLRSHMLKS